MTAAAVETRPPEGATKSLVVSFAREGNSDAFAREGWRPSEPNHRWSAGERSLLILPALAASPRFALTLHVDFAPAAAVQRTLALELNGVPLATLQPTRGVPQCLVVPGEIVSDRRENTLVCHYSDALAPDNRDPRWLAVAWRALELTPDDTPPFGEPEPLPEADPAALPMQEVVAVFQSLGQNCELGIMQRRCGAEPIGLLRFAGIFADRLMHGLRARFAGVEAADKLALVPAKPGGELMGRHAFYGFSYHTYKNECDVDVADFKVKEARRLGYLARLLFEQIENDEKIFVRIGGFEAEGELRALYRLLRSFNPDARLLMVLQDPERAGRVERIAPNLYRGYLSKMADPARVPGTLAYEDWLKVCATLYVDQQKNGRIDPPA